MKQRLIGLIFFFGLVFPMSSLHAGTILNTAKFAWSNQAGYLNFDRLIVDDFVLSGFAWSANYGWIKFDPAEGGVLNDGNGNLSGSAWGEQLGWIDFNNVSINPSTGKFSGTATNDILGTLTFDCANCDVETDWRPASTPPSPPPVVPSGAGGNGAPQVLPLVSTIPVPSSPNDVTFEQVLAATPDGQAPYRADMFRDNQIDLLDFNVLMVHWGEATGDANSLSCKDKIFADINCDGMVDIIDFNLLMVYWGMTVSPQP